MPRSNDFKTSAKTEHGIRNRLGDRKVALIELHLPHPGKRLHVQLIAAMRNPVTDATEIRDFTHVARRDYIRIVILKLDPNMVR